MKNNYTFLFACFITWMNPVNLLAQCEVHASVNPDNVVCGDCVTLTAYGRGQGLSVFTEDFNSGAPTGWAYTQQAMFNNPCSPNGVDGTPHIWMGNSSPVPRALETVAYDFTSATAGVTVCFDMLFATQTGSGGTACEGPDEPDEGVYLQYSTDGGNTWIAIHYFDPNGGNDPLLTNWNNWCFELPPDAITPNTQIRWYQDNDSGADYDHWGIDNVNIFFNDPTYEIVWQHDNYSYGVGSSGGVNPNPACPRANTSYIVVMSNGTHTCSDTVNVTVDQPAVYVDAGADTTVCLGECVTLNATAKVVKRPAKTISYQNNELESIATTLGTSTSININVQGLNMTQILPNSIVEVCINNLTFFGIDFTQVPPVQQTIGDLIIYLVCPDGTKIRLIPSGVTTSPDPLTGYTNTCFTLNSTNDISQASPPYTGDFMPDEPFNNLAGCTANGLWAIEVAPAGNLSFGSGTFYGWSITFDDPEISYTADYIWQPTTGMTGSNTLTPQVCPTADQTYHLTATDTAGCITVHDSVSVTVDSVCCRLQIQQVNTTNPACGMADGAITVSVSGNQGNVSYSIDNGNTFQSSPTFGNLDVGAYYVVALDSAGCSDTVIALLINTNGPDAQINAVQDEHCRDSDGSAQVSATGGTPPYQYQWSNGQTTATATGLPAGIHTVTVTDQNGCADVEQVRIYRTGVPQLSTQLSPVSCHGYSDGIATVIVNGGTPPYSYSWSNGATSQTVSGLPAGAYTITVADQTGCTATTSVQIPQPARMVISAAIEDESCTGAKNGAIDLEVTGGAFPLNYAWSNGLASQDLSNLPGGLYTVTVTDANGCVVADSFYVNSSSFTVQISAAPDTIIPAGEQVTLQVTPDNITIQWLPPVDVGQAGNPVITVSPVTSATYTVQGSDSSGCLAYDSIFIRVLERGDIKVASAFTPNQDGVNDWLGLFHFGDVELIEFKIFNRWGQVVFETNDINARWDGTFKNEPADVGTYVYYVKFRALSENGEVKTISGNVTLIR